MNQPAAPGRERFLQNPLGRFAAWLGVYSIGPIAFCIYAFVQESNRSPATSGNPDNYVQTFFLSFLAFPLGLVPGVPPVGYVFYLAHLIFALTVRNGKLVRIALLLLVGIVSLNFVSCVDMDDSLKHFAP